MPDPSVSQSESMTQTINDEMQRLARGIELLDHLRELFGTMEDDRERDRAWNYLRDRFVEFEKADRPSHFEGLIDDA